MKKKLLSALIMVMLSISLVACGGNQMNSDSDSTQSQTDNENASEEIITIHVFTGLADRKTGTGLIEEILFEQYMKENPNIKIEVEALDGETYKTKFKAYATSSEMPDLLGVWGQPAFINEIIDAGLLAELNPEDYKDYGFVKGALDGFSKDGKLYGLPRSTDIMGFYYNKAIFEENGWEVPKTYNELIELAGKIREAGLIPVSMDGADKWPLAIYLNDLIAKIDGDNGDKISQSIANGDFSDPTYKKAAELLRKSVEAGLFQNGFETTDYATAFNLFANGQAAMYYMGNWEMSIATNPDVLPEIRENIGVFAMPEVEGGKGKVTDIAAWNGVGYSISANSPVKEEAIKLLNYMMKPENLSKLTWQNGVGMSAQDYSGYLTGDETVPQKIFTNILMEATSITGTPINDLGTSAFKTVCEDLCQELAIGAITPEEFIQKLEEATK
ncbi:ABC transporter substrate-binding protein [Defluviitalea phaphyphila]|uniref:ABC transporter substrate-binding protein n=1 Tax=Defluviitalea phaphyphila TaxID=1473580 RepID=UPI0007308746|nr:extracellular solute-binding protein [Defluviitalea phaphyphila]